MHIVSLLFALILFTPHSFAESIQFEKMNLKQGYDYNIENKESFGYLLSFKLGTTSLAKEESVMHPLTRNKIPAVAVISAFNWDKNIRNPFQIEFYVNAANKKLLNGAITNARSNLDVEFNFQIFSVNKEKSQVYPALKTLIFPKRGIMNKIGHQMEKMKPESLPLVGLIMKEKSKVSIEVESTASLVLNKQSYFLVKAIISPYPGKPQQFIRALSLEETGRIPWGM